MEANHLKVGKIGENIACKFLMKQNYSVIDRNFSEKWGELDIVANKEGITYFIEVKAVSIDNVNHETLNSTFPEENITDKKGQRLKRIIQSYCLKKGINGDIKFAVVAVILDKDLKKGRVRFYPEVILE